MSIQGVSHVILRRDFKSLQNYKMSFRKNEKARVSSTATSTFFNLNLTDSGSDYYIKNVVDRFVKCGSTPS